MQQSNKIGDFLIQEIAKGTDSPVRIASDYFHVSRQAVNRHLKQLVQERLIIAEGQTRNRKYRLRELVNQTFTVDLTTPSQEDKLWRDQVRPLLDVVPENVLNICQYGFTEIMNNAIEHSEGTLAEIQVKRTAANIILIVTDNGIGIFNKIKREFNLDDERDAILELAKGKLTTEPANHTGEGIFFTSRVFDEFRITSGKLHFRHEWGEDWLVDTELGNSPSMRTDGTRVFMYISVFSKRTLNDVFNEYAGEPGLFGFDKTHIPMSLAQYGDEKLISRSQAKRVMNRVERFREIVLDFSNVNLIGQAFADEIFRVFQNQHPEINLQVVNANPQVQNMITRVLSSSETS